MKLPETSLTSREFEEMRHTKKEDEDSQEDDVDYIPFNQPDQTRIQHQQQPQRDDIHNDHEDPLQDLPDYTLR